MDVGLDQLFITAVVKEEKLTGNVVTLNIIYPHVKDGVL